MTTPDATMPDAMTIEATAEMTLSHDRRRVAANFVALTLANIMTRVVGLFTSVYVRRTLGVVAIGQVNWNAALLAYLGLVANPGVQVIGQREIAKHPGQTAALTSLILTIQLALAVAAYILVLVLAGFHVRGSHVSALLVIQGLSLFLTAANVQWVLQGHERMVGPSLVGLVTTALQIPVMIVFLHSPDDVFLYAFLTLPFLAIAAAYNFWCLQHHGLMRLSELRPTLRGAKAMLGESWPLALSQGAILIYYNSAALILGFTHGDKAVGLYTTAYNLMLLSAMVSNALWNAYFPLLARAFASPSQAARVAQEFLTLLVWMGVPIAGLGWALGRHVVALLFGPEFAEAGRYFEWLCLDVALVFINIGIGSPFLAWGLQKLHFKITGTAAVANLALNLLLIPFYGAWGAVFTTIFAEVVVFVIVLTVRRRMALARHPILPVILPPLCCTTVVALAMSLLPQSLARYWWTECALGCVVLGGCLYIFERRIITKTLKLFQG